MSANNSKPKKRHKRLKFPQTRRDRLKAAGDPDHKYVGISRLSSIHSMVDNDQRGQFPSITGRSMDNVSLSYPSQGYGPQSSYGRWPNQPYSGDTDIPPALINESWSEWGRRAPGPHPQMYDEDMLDSNGQSRPALSPTGGSRVVFTFPDQEEGPRANRLSSEIGSQALHDDTRDAGGRAMPLHPIKEYEPSNVSSLILFGPEIASRWDFFFPLVSIFGYLVDTGSDIWLAYKYFSFGHYGWFTLTLLFILLPSIAMTIFSLILWVRNSIIVKDPVHKWQWVCRVLSLLFMMSPLTRLADVLYYAYQSRNSKRDWYLRRKFYERMLDEDTDCNLVRLFETFLENAPQLVLQLYVISQLGTDEGTLLVVVQCIGLVTSWLTMTWSLVAFHTALRASLPDKARLNNIGKLGMFFWRLFTIASRVIALALFASHFKWFVLVFAGAHFVVMFFWVARQKTVYCTFKVLNTEGKVTMHHSDVLEFFFRVMAAFVHIFCFLNLLEGHSRLRCLAYYGLVYMENAVLALLWYVNASTLSDYSWYHMPALLMVLLGFWTGVTFQLIYYRCCHPNSYHAAKSDYQIQLCVPCSELSLFSGLELYEHDISAEEAQSLAVSGPRGWSSSRNTPVSRSRTVLDEPTASSIQWDPNSYPQPPPGSGNPLPGRVPFQPLRSEPGLGYAPVYRPQPRYQEPEYRPQPRHQVPPEQPEPQPVQTKPARPKTLQKPGSPPMHSSPPPGPPLDASSPTSPPLQTSSPTGTLECPGDVSQSPRDSAADVPSPPRQQQHWKRVSAPPKPPILQCKTTLV